MNSKDTIKDSRIIYSLAMVLILYEFYKSKFLIGEDPLFLLIKIVLFILIFTQLIFLLLCGLSHAEINKEYMEKLLEKASFYYTVGFQSSFVLFFLGVFCLFTYNTFKSVGIFFTLWGKILFMVINVLIVIGAIRTHKKFFINRQETNELVYWVIRIWVFLITVFILSKILQE